MKCPHCPAGSDVSATRKYLDVMLKRTRRCFNGHTFQTYEVFSGNLDRRTLVPKARGVAAKAKAWHNKHVVLHHPEMSATALAAQLALSEARVRQIRAAAK